MAVTTFRQFVAEETSARTEAQEHTSVQGTVDRVLRIRRLLIALIGAGAIDKFIKRDLVESIGDIYSDLYTHDATNDAERFSTRLQALKRGMVALLQRDEELDDVLLKRYGIAAGDVTTETTDPDRAVLKSQQDNLKRASLRNKQQQLRVKQAQVQQDLTKVATDIAQLGQKRVTR